MFVLIRETQELQHHRAEHKRHKVYCNDCREFVLEKGATRHLATDKHVVAAKRALQARLENTENDNETNPAMQAGGRAVALAAQKLNAAGLGSAHESDDVVDNNEHNDDNAFNNDDNGDDGGHQVIFFP